MRYLLSWNRFVCRLSMWGCVPFWVEADSLPNWVCGDVFAFEWKQIRYCLRLRRCVTFWVETDSFADWVCGDALPSELIQFRLLIEYVWMRSLLSRSRFVCWLSMWECVGFWGESNTLLFEIEEVRYLLSWNRFVCWLSMWGCVNFWVEANTFTVWDWGDALPSKLIQFRLLIELLGMR